MEKEVGAKSNPLQKQTTEEYTHLLINDSSADSIGNLASDSREERGEVSIILTAL